MFSLQSTLAKSPINSLQDSCNKLLEWAEPLLTAQEYLRTKDIITQFTHPEGEGEKLQKALLDLAENENTVNWTAAVWLDFYLSGRYPLAINSNVFYYLKSKLNPNEFSQTQIASALIMCIFEFNTAIENETLSIDKLQGDKPLCMAQYKNMFSATRIPQKGKDQLTIARHQKHIVILCKGHIFKLEIINEQGEIHSFSMIEEALQQIIKVSTQGQNIGILTTLPRDEWAENRVALQTLDKKNKSQLKSIEDALFSLSLDENSPEQLAETSKMLLHGEGKDRYFDKSLQFMVFKNGKTGINFEHSGMDGSVMLRMIGHLYDNIARFPDQVKASSMLTAEPLIFQLDSQLIAELDKAQGQFLSAVENTQTRTFSFSEFGKEQIKNFKISPDAFVQIALQLAEYKLYGKCYSAYEAIMTRGVITGRIDVLYAVSSESLAFIKSVKDKHCDGQTKKSLLISASEKHIARAHECRRGEGIHTHFLGLLKCFKTQGDKIGINALPEIFTDQAYQSLIHTVVCSSTTSEYGVELAGYGPVVEYGYGIRYFTRADSIGFNITSRTHNKDNLDLLVKYIGQSFAEMAAVMRNI